MSEVFVSVARTPFYLYTTRQMLLALSFLTRIPIKSLDFSKADLARAAVYFPIVGTLIGGVGAGVFYAASKWFSVDISIALVLGFLILLTGALHEDGLADAFDAFGSKNNKEEILEVMRDSRIGTYGTLALVLMLLLKYLGLHEMTPQIIMIALVVAHTVSRWATLPTLVLLPYPRKSAAWSKRFVERVADMPRYYLILSTLYTVLICFGLFRLKGLVLFGLACVISALCALYFKRKIQGATGDCYGTIQQCTEVGVYLAILVLI